MDPYYMPPMHLLANILFGDAAVLDRDAELADLEDKLELAADLKKEAVALRKKANNLTSAEVAEYFAKRKAERDEMDAHLYS